MPNRILREGIVTSPRVIQLSWPAEVFYRRLMSVVDDFGRYHAHPMLLRAACYPLQLDKVSDSDLGKWLAETRKAALVRVYEVAGQQYLELLDFRQQQRAKKSKFPQPLADDTHTHSTCAADAQQMQSNAHLDVCEDVCVDEPAPRKRAARKPTPIPEDFGISERVQKWAEEREIYNLPQHLEHFVSRAKAKAYTYVDWDEAFMGAVRADWAKIGKGSAGNGKWTI